MDFSSPEDSLSPSPLPSTATPPASLPPPVTWVEWDHLRFRVVALESLFVALLTDLPASRLERLDHVVRQVPPLMPGVEHPLSQLAAAQTLHLLERAHRLKKQPTP